MSILGDVFGFLFGGKSQKADWKQIERLMEMQSELNRTNRHGYFSNWDWSEGPDGSWTQSQTLTPGLESAANRLLGRANGEGYQPYQSPAQFSSLLDAKMANQMQRHGILDENSLPNLRQENFGDRAGDRQGGWWSLHQSRQGGQPPMITPPPDQGGGGGPPQGGSRGDPGHLGGTGRGYYDYKARQRWRDK